MSSDVLARLPQVRQLSVPSTLVSLICHVPPRSHVYHVKKIGPIVDSGARFVHVLSDAIGALDKEQQRIFMMYAASKQGQTTGPLETHLIPNNIAICDFMTGP